MRLRVGPRIAANACTDGSGGAPQKGGARLRGRGRHVGGLVSLPPILTRSWATSVAITRAPRRRAPVI
jgi:hypothetical protein